MNNKSHNKLTFYLKSFLYIIFCITITLLQAFLISLINSNIGKEYLVLLVQIVGFIAICFILYKAGKNKYLPGIICIITIILLTAFVFSFKNENSKNPGGMADQYSELFLPCINGGISTGTADTGKDKLITCVIHEQEPHWSKDYIPKGYVSRGIDDVGGLVIVIVEDKKVGTYTNGGIAYQYLYTVSIKDPYSGQIIASNDFYGGYPPESTSKSVEFGEVPSAEQIKKWVNENWSEYHQDTK